MSRPQRSDRQPHLISKFLQSAQDEAVGLFFPPKCTVRCVGRPMFRTQAARDVGCLLDVDPTVISWTCLPLVLSRRNRHHVPDFSITRPEGVSLVDAQPMLGKRPVPEWVVEAAQAMGYQHETHQEAELRGSIRLENARDLLQYAAYRPSLGDRVRILALLEESGSMPLSSCLEAIQSGRDAIAVIASLALQRFIEIELDDARIGPGTIVSRFRG
ncbi:hypothetical protein ACTZWT_07690 [Rhodopseudomonas sp. NSM]|uniref:hypothetical protein n=1 Tax=Rhodopseudomonas sp. NSM TaxID=3457630 RepID=UPI004036994B